MSEIEITNNSSPLFTNAQKTKMSVATGVILAALGGMLLYCDHMVHMKIAAEIFLGSAQFFGVLAVYYHFKDIDGEKRNYAKWIFLALLVGLIGLNGAIYSQFILKAHSYQTLSFTGAFVLGGVGAVLLASKSRAERNIQRHEAFQAETKAIFNSEYKVQIRQRLDQVKLEALVYAMESANPTFVEAVYEKYPKHGTNLLSAAIKDKREDIAFALAIKGVQPGKEVQSEGLVAAITSNVCRFHESFLLALIAMDLKTAKEALQYIRKNYSRERREEIFNSIFKDPQLIAIFRNDKISNEAVKIIFDIYKEVRPTDVPFANFVKMALFAKLPALAKELLIGIRSLKIKNEIFAKLFVIDDYTKLAFTEGYDEIISILFEEAKKAGNFNFVADGLQLNAQCQEERLRRIASQLSILEGADA